MNYFEFFRNNLKAKHYFQYHEVFNKLNEKEEKNTKTLDARKARILKYNSHKINNKNFKISFLENLQCPVFKLSHKTGYKNLSKMMKNFEELNKTQTKSKLFL